MKGEGSKKKVDEIRMGYDDTELSLNDAVWNPWSAMPNVDCHLRAVEARTFMTDFDVEEIFLNFMLEPFLRPHAGVDLISVFLEGKWKFKRMVGKNCHGVWTFALPSY